MSQLQPPSPEPEFLRGGTSASTPRSGRGRAVGLGIGAVVAAGAIAAGTWGVSKLSGGGPGAAQVLPAGALAYASVDLDPSAGQKIEAYQTLRKFPALKEQLDLDSHDDLRKALVQALLDDDCGLTYSEDFEPWLGDKAGVALVKADSSDQAEPQPVVAIESTDDDKAVDGVRHIFESCAPEEEFGVSSLDGYVLVGPSQQVVDDARTAAEHKPLSEDGAFNDQVDKLGDPGIVSFYVAKEAAGELAQAAQESTAGLVGDAGAMAGGLDDLADSFGGAAGTLRFNDGGLEFEAVATSADLAGQGTATTVGNLPDTTVAALGVGFSDEQLAKVTGRLGKGGLNGATEQFEQETGVPLDEAINTLLGGGLVLALDGTSDFTHLDNGPEGLKAGLRISGDPDKITDLLSGMLGRLGGLDGLVTESSQDAVAVGFDQAYLKELLAGGDLGSTDAFTAAVPHAGTASGVLYLDTDGTNDWLVELAKSGDPAGQRTVDNLAPLSSFGVSAWTDGADGHLQVKLTTD